MATPKEILRFYWSKEWKRARKLKLGTARGICETCGKAGWEVHHIIPLTLSNYKEPEIALGQDNLKLLCTSCHNSERAIDKDLREDLVFDSQGQVIPKIKRRN